MKRAIALFAVLLSLVPMLLQAQERAYTEGSVLEITAVRVKDGQWDAYMTYLKDSYKPLLEEQKKAGVIADYAVYATTPRSPNDPNLYLSVVYPNMASLDGLDDKTEPLVAKVLGQTRAQGEKAYAERSSMREILGTELIRQLNLK